jgi:hypothetical protein
MLLSHAVFQIMLLDAVLQMLHVALCLYTQDDLHNVCVSDEVHVKVYWANQRKEEEQFKAGHIWYEAH